MGEGGIEKRTDIIELQELYELIVIWEYGK